MTRLLQLFFTLMAIVIFALIIMLATSDSKSYFGSTPPFTFTLNRTEKRSTMLLPGVSRSSCPCGGVQLTSAVPKESLSAVQDRRAKAYRQHQIRTTTSLNKIILALPNSPLQYPIHGLTVAPMKKSAVPGLALHADERDEYEVSLSVQKGVLSVNNDQEGVEVKGQDQSTLTISSSSLDLLNLLLSRVMYTSTVYHIRSSDMVNNDQEGVEVKGQDQSTLTISSSSLDLLNLLLSRVMYTSTVYHIRSSDMVYFSFEDFEAIFSITISRPSIPVLYDPGEDINSLVTIATKTFIRYSQLKVLINSIRQFYPDIKIVIADDSLKPENVSGTNVEQYIMPPAQGWFAGRNLAISQVTTKYVLWVDDDYLFLEKTSIESFVKVMEAVPELDVLGGNVDGNQFYFSLMYDEGDEDEGGCLTRSFQKVHGPVPGFDGCYFVDGVVNFFLARTDAVRKVGFDPVLKRIAHTEFFIDGLGDLMVATCKELSVGHQKRKFASQYNKYRYPKNDEQGKQAHIFFKNHLKCIKY